ncbi:MAG: DUF4331 domain-containing protein [Pseudomonadota bacterium]
MKTQTRYMMGTALAGVMALSAPMATASSHREAPAIAGMPRVDATDFYMFRSYEPGREAFVTLIANYIPIQAPYGGPNYFTLDNDAVYEILIDNTGDAIEDLTFQFDFSTALANAGAGIALDIGGTNVGIPLRQAGAIGTTVGSPSINETESYTLNVVRGDRRTGEVRPVNRLGNNTARTFTKPIDNIGSKTIPDYPAYADAHITPIRVPGCDTPGKVFVGQRAEGFAVNLGRVFDLVNLVPIQGASNPSWNQYNTPNRFPGGIMQDRANDDLVGKANVTSIALELPISCLTGTGNGVIGGWTTASLPQNVVRSAGPSYNATSTQSGPLVQVSRLSNPLVNEVVIGLKDKDLFNAAEPTQDGALAGYVTNPTLPALVDLLFRDAVGATSNIAPTNIPRNDLVTAFLTGFPGVNQLATVTGSEMLRLNTGFPVTPRGRQNTFGLVAEDLAGFPNGRRPGDDTVDIALRVVMGALCHPLPLATELGVAGAVEDTPSDFVNLGICSPDQAPVGTAALTDGAPLRATDFQNKFPYLNSPLGGATNG